MFANVVNKLGMNFFDIWINKLKTRVVLLNVIRENTVIAVKRNSLVAEVKNLFAGSFASVAITA